MLRQVKINQSAWFSDQTNLGKLNDLMALHDHLSPHVIMGATGCSFDDALYVLMRLFDCNLADGFLLIYDKDNPAIALDKRPFARGYPELPEQYYYGFDFAVLDRVEFVTG